MIDMSYESPINIIYGPSDPKLENEVLTVIHNLGIDVDKEELVRVLRYDREQYQKGYEDRDKEIVRCKDCKYKGQTIHQEDGTIIIVCWNQGYGIHHPIDWFCGDGKKAEHIIAEQNS